MPALVTLRPDVIINVTPNPINEACMDSYVPKLFTEEVSCILSHDNVTVCQLLIEPGPRDLLLLSWWALHVLVY